MKFHPKKICWVDENSILVVYFGLTMSYIQYGITVSDTSIVKNMLPIFKLQKVLLMLDCG